MRKGFYFLSMICAFAAGALLFGAGGPATIASGSVATIASGSAAPADPAAYLLAVGKRLKPPEALASYRQAAGPLAMKAGYQLLATQPDKANVQVLEGQWPYEGFVTLEKFTSMNDLLTFWHSEGYQSAKKLRADAIKMDFIIAVEGSR
jgi:uncharacterized protein (DUF1330 family)